jgi:predicted TIM-barrel fold metal-dependent hydrolase
VYTGPLIDCDVHNNPKHPKEYLEYMPARWRDLLTASGDSSLPGLQAPFIGSTSVPNGLAKRHETYSEKGPPGSDLDMMREHLLDAFDIETAVLGHDVGSQAALLNGELALVVCRASNDWMADRWLGAGGDDRLCGAILVPTQTPSEAAAEIRRVAQNQRFVSALIAFNGLGKPLGHPANHEMYEAMAEVGVPMHVHVNGGEYFGAAANLAAGGGPFGYKFEQYQHVHQPTVNHLTSLIVQGVFEKYPTLKLLLTEAGLSWIPWFVARLDSNFDLMRRESEWVKKLPSEYFREHVFLATQPCEGTPQDRAAFLEDLMLLDGIDDMLVFTTDYPHWDADDPRFTWSIFPQEWHDKIGHENARRVLRLPASRARPIDRSFAVT